MSSNTTKAIEAEPKTAGVGPEKPSSKFPSNGIPDEGLPAENPRPPFTAFSIARRNFLLIIVTAGGFTAPLAGNIYLPALPTLEGAFRVSTELINLTVGVFMLIFAFSPLFWGAQADIFGRKLLYSISIALFVSSNVALAAAPARYGSLMALRILQAFGSSSVMSLGAGTIADIFEPKLRARAVSFFSLGPQLGPVLGPVVGGAIIQKATWRWLFGFLAIYGFLIFIWMLVCLPETLRSRVGNGAIYEGQPWIAFPNFSRKAPIAPGTPMPKRPGVRGIFVLMKYPPIILVSVNVAVIFGSYYCVAVTFPTFLKRIYGFSPASIGASYLSPGVP
ncbi:hypothetical protein GP486_008009 [Trichoglossum hirsutum]|uniref:Major facilitator superfamily (MFS) profile domain-containing protein n=1 Tax=Trichoglossum hirsutum TaxID=265104 RepID=A0A9P8IAS5_9PEZI|nr:hypothetical protein GP486_008009 [Trichoglossum hirsutum]